MYAVDPARRAKILGLYRFADRRNRSADAVARGLVGLFCGFSVFVVLFWGVGFGNIPQLLSFWSKSIAFFGLPVFVWLFFREGNGLASWLHPFRGGHLSIETGNVTLQLRRHKKRFAWSMRLDDIRRIDYDRSLKTVRLTGKLDPAATKTADWSRFPEGMRTSALARTAPSCVDIPLIFAEPEHFLQRLQNESRCYVHPAIRGDDLADLRDLPGVRRDPDLLRPFTLLLVGSSAVVLLLAFGLRVWINGHPYTPFPPNDPAILARIASVGETVVLDNCNITLDEDVRVVDGNAQVLEIPLTLKNNNALPIRAAPSNFRLCADAERIEPCSVPLGILDPRTLPERLEPNREVYVNLYFPLPSARENLTLEVNSEHFPIVSRFSGKQYKGETVTFRLTIKS